MITEEEMAFLKDHLADLPATALKKLRRDIVTERRRNETEETAKAKEWGDRPTRQPSERHTGCNEEGTAVLQTAARATAGKRKANELNSSASGGSKEPATRRPAPGPVPGEGSAPLPAQAKGAPTQDRADKPKSTGEEAASSGRQFSYAEGGKAYAWVVAGRPVKGFLGTAPH
jgi:hypothetical protein